MTVISDFLTPEWIEGRLQSMDAAEASGMLPSPQTDKEWRTAASRCMERFELEYARGANAARLRQLCRDFTGSFAPVVAQMDFTPEVVRGESMLPSSAKNLAERFGGRWWKSSPHHAGMEYTAIPQPFSLAMPDVWMIAAVGGDLHLARKVAEPYRVHEPHQVDDVAILLRHALAEDHDAERALAARMQPGYPADFPPMLIEFPLGVINNDPKTLQSAVKKVSTRFKGMWRTRKYRDWYDKRLAQYGTASFRSPPPWEKFLNNTKRDLFGYHWVISWWALAWLNVARWRGVDEVFENPKVFTEWVPLELAAE